MKFHLKMTLCMLAVLAVLFGAGGSLLISESFEDSLEREKAAALGDYRMAWGTLQIVNSMDAYLDRDAIVKTMEQLYQQNSASWSALRLSTGDEVLYENRGTQSSLIQTAWSIEDPTPGICLFRILDNGAGAHFLVFGRQSRPMEMFSISLPAMMFPLYTQPGRPSSTPISRYFS